MRSGGSILAADFGSATTRVLLFDMVDGEYRLVARRETLTTSDAPHHDVGLGLRRLLRDMGSAMGRNLLDTNGTIITPEGDDRSGVDTFVATASVGRPMRVVMVNILHATSLKFAIRAISGAYVEVVAVLTLQETPDLQDQLNTILLAQPDLVLFSGGVDDGPRQALLRLAAGLRLALQVVERSVRPTVVYAGNAALAEHMEALFTDLTEVIIADNVMPVYDIAHTESAEAAVNQAYERYAQRFGQGFESVIASSSGMIPTAQAYELMTRHLARESGGNVIVADIGSASALVYVVIDGTLYTRISPQHGLGHSARALLNTVGANAIRAWLPMNIRASELDNLALNKSLRPTSVPDTARDLYIEHAFLRAGMRHLLHDMSSLWHGTPTNVLPPIGTIVVGGAALTRTGKPGYNLLLTADTIQPVGVTQVYADAYGIIPALGSLARVNAEATIQLLDNDTLDLLGTLVSLEGKPRSGRVAAKLTIRTGNERIKYALQGGEILFLPLPLGYTLDLDIRCQGSMRIMGRSRLRLTIQGGSGGVLIDGRGRSFDAGNTVQERADRLPRWIHVATDDPEQPIPAEWLSPLADDIPSEAAPVNTHLSRADRKRAKEKSALEAELMDDDLQSLLDEPPAMTLSEMEVGSKSLKSLRQPTPEAAPFLEDDDDLRKLL